VRTAVALIAAGVLALVISAWQYRLLVRYHLWSAPFRPLAGIEAKAMIPIVAQTPLMAIVLAIIVIGVFAFGAVLLRVV
jgi:putative membrane protein